MHMMNHSLADITFFYQRQPPEEIFKLLEIFKHILGITKNQETRSAEKCSYRAKMHQVYFYNSLALFGMKYKQFSFAEDCFETIFQHYLEESVDSHT